MFGGLIGTTQMTATNAAKTVLAIIKAAVAGGKTTKAGNPSLSEVAADVAGSVAFTVTQSSLDSTTKAAIQTLLLDAAKKTAAGIAGSANTLVVYTAMQDAFNGVNTDRFENGTDFAGTGTVSDPETDVRSF